MKIKFKKHKKAPWKLKKHVPLPQEHVVTVEFLDPSTFRDCAYFLKGRSKVYLSEFLQWVKKCYGVGA